MVITPVFLTPLILLVFFATCWLMSRSNYLPHLNNEQSNEQNRSLYIDGLRGIAAVLVVCAHSWWVIRMGYDRKPLLSYDFSYNQQLGAIGVQIFFAITGYLFFSKIKNGKLTDTSRFFISRVKRLTPLYVFAIATLYVITIFNTTDVSTQNVAAMLKYLAFGFFPGDVTIDGFNAGQLVSVIWTLPYEWQFYFCLPVLAAMCTQRRYENAAIILSIALALLSMYLYGHCYWAFFMVGVAAYYAEKNINKFNSAICAFLLFAVFMANIYSIFTGIEKYGLARFVLSSLLFVLIVIVKPRFLTDAALRYMGEISYSIYLLHIMMFFLYTKFVYNTIEPGVINDWQFYAMTAPLFFIMTVVCSTTFKYIEHPFLKKSKVHPDISKCNKA